MSYETYGKKYRNNVEIRSMADRRGVFFWEIARWIGVTPTRLSCMMRDEIPKDSKLYRDIVVAVDMISKEHNEVKR